MHNWVIFLLSAIFFLILSNSNFAIKSDPIDCFICAQNIPTCDSCQENEFCYVSKRSCYQCSRAVCANIKYKQNRKSCNSSRKPTCRCSQDKTCLITVRNRIACSTAVCIESVGPTVKFLEDYIP